MNTLSEHLRVVVMRTFAYLRVSTAEQANINQLAEIERAGFVIEPHRVFSDEVSGTVAAAERNGFQTLMQKLERGDRLVISKIDRLGRSALDIMKTLENFENLGVSVVCLQLQGTDLTSTAGKLLVTMLSAIAQMERDMISERTKNALARKKAEGAVLGRPEVLTTQQKQELVSASKLSSFTVSAAARQYQVSRQSVLRAIGRL